MLDVKRPGTGILPKFFSKIIGYKAQRDIDEDTTLQWNDISENI